MRALDHHKAIDALRGVVMNRYAPRVAGAVLLVVFAWQTAAAVDTVLSTGPEAAITATQPSASSATGNHSSDRAARVAGLHLFGRAEATEGSADQPAVDAPETSLDLVLRGVYMPGQRGGVAIIATGDSQDVYRTGDTIAGGARITAILDDRVVISRDGRAETVRLPRGRDPAKPGAS